MIGINKIGIVCTLMLPLLVGCSSSSTGQQGQDLLVSVKGESLYRHDLQDAMPVGLHGEDSARFAAAYIQNWLEDAILYKQAEENIPKNVEVEELVAAYRRSLVIHAYQEELLRQKLGDGLSDDEVQSYYEQHKELFLADCPYVKGLFLKVPLNSPNMAKVRSWCRGAKVDDWDKLEKYSIANAVQFDYFNERWVSVASLAAKIPQMPQLAKEDYLRQNRNVEAKDSAYYYILHVDDFLPTGDLLPIDNVKTEIKDMLMNVKRAEFVRQMKTDLYKEALDNKEITYYTR